MDLLDVNQIRLIWLILVVSVYWNGVLCNPLGQVKDACEQTLVLLSVYCMRACVCIYGPRVSYVREKHFKWNPANCKHLDYGVQWVTVFTFITAAVFPSDHFRLISDTFTDSSSQLLHMKEWINKCFFYIFCVDAYACSWSWCCGCCFNTGRHFAAG